MTKYKIAHESVTLSPEQEIRLRPNRGLHVYLQVLLNKRLEENCGEVEKSLKPFCLICYK